MVHGKATGVIASLVSCVLSVATYAVSVLEWLSLLGLAGYAEVLHAHGFDHLEYMVSFAVCLSVGRSVCLSVCLSACLSCLSVCVQVCVQY